MQTKVNLLTIVEDSHLMEKICGILIMTLTRNVINFGIYNSSSPHIDNPKHYFSVLGKGPTVGFTGSVAAAGKEISMNFTKANTKLWLSLHYNSDKSYFHVNKTKIYKLKQKVT